MYNLLPKITIVGATGFIGSNLSKYFKNLGYEVKDIFKGDQILREENYGVVLYCAGVTHGFRERPLDVINAHVNHLIDWLDLAHFDKLIYFSSARIYMNNTSSLETVEDFIVNRNDSYNLTKILGESICQSSKKNTLVLRISHVIGYDPTSPSFFWNVLRQYCIDSNTVTIEEAPECKRDYIYVEDLLIIIKKLITIEKIGIYNVSSGISIENRELVSLLNEFMMSKVVIFEGKKVNFPPIENKKIVKELGTHFLETKKLIKMMCNQYKKVVMPS